MRLIGIAGKAGSGKDTVADYLVQKYGFVRYALADPIKNMLDAIGVDCRDRETKELPHPVFGVSPRRMAQTLGTEWMRDSVVGDGWLRLADEFIKVKRALNTFDDVPPAGIVIPDIRFENEAEWLRNKGGLLWHVMRDVGAVESHISESGVKAMETDKALDNFGSIADLHEQILMIMEGKK